MSHKPDGGVLVDTITLVAEQIDDGQRLIDRLSRENLPVRSACWVKPIEQDRWSLYLATPLVDEKGSTSAYGEVYRVLRSLGNVVCYGFGHQIDWRGRPDYP